MEGYSIFHCKYAVFDGFVHGLEILAILLSVMRIPA